MADAIPVSGEGTEKKPKKGAAASVSSDMKAAVAAQAQTVPTEADFKAEGGAALLSHNATREDR